MRNQSLSINLELERKYSPILRMRPKDFLYVIFDVVLVVLALK